MKEKKSLLAERLQKYRECDPSTLADIHSGIKVGKEGANRWTDNVFAIHSWIGKKFPNLSVKDLNQQFGVPEDMDYLE